jgi:predicted DNA-binding transcriptional regulator YafY
VFDARMRVLGLGTGAQIIEPAELRESILETAHSILTAYG